MPVLPYPIDVLTNASDASTPFPNVNVSLKNVTKNQKLNSTTGVDGHSIFTLTNYSNGDILQVQARFGSFYQISTGTVDTVAGSTSFSLTLGALEQGNIKMIDILSIKEELVKFLRKNLTDPQNRLTTKIDVFMATANQLKFTLTDTTAKVIKRVTVNNTPLTEYSQYYADYEDDNTLNYPSVFLLTPLNLNDAVEIEYTVGTSDWVYPDYPRVDITVDDYPRVMVDFLTMTSKEISLGAQDNQSELVVSSIVWSLKPNELYTLISQVRQLFMENKKNFFWFNLITPLRISPVIKSPGRADKVLQQSQDFNIPFRFEAIV